MTNQTKTPRFCLKCGADRKELSSMMHEPNVISFNEFSKKPVFLESENHQIARQKIAKCDECKKVFYGSK